MYFNISIFGFGCCLYKFTLFGVIWCCPRYLSISGTHWLRYESFSRLAKNDIKIPIECMEFWSESKKTKIWLEGHTNWPTDIAWCSSWLPGTGFLVVACTGWPSMVATMATATTKFHFQNGEMQPFSWGWFLAVPYSISFSEPKLERQSDPLVPTLHQAVLLNASKLQILSRQRTVGWILQYMIGIMMQNRVLFISQLTLFIECNCD